MIYKHKRSGELLKQLNGILYQVVDESGNNIMAVPSWSNGIRKMPVKRIVSNKEDLEFYK